MLYIYFKDSALEATVNQAAYQLQQNLGGELKLDQR